MTGKLPGWTGPLLWPLLFLLTGISAVVALGMGPVAISPGEILQVLLEALGMRGGVSGGVAESTRLIVSDLRLPRVAMALLVGSALGVAGTTFQGLFKNPMADPYIIGVSSGAALGATTALALGLNVRLLGFGAVPVFAFIGALATVFLVYRLARVGDRVPVMTLLLAGIAVGTFLGAVVNLLTYFSDRQLHQIIFWMMGSLSGRGWDYFWVGLPYCLLGLGVVMALSRDLNALLLGEEPAQTLGIEVENVKRLLLAAASLLTATAVATAGLIGFVGLVIPHICRLLLWPDHRTLVPATALVGAVFMLWVDTAARSLMPPLELPVGVLTALVGGPFFIALLMGRKQSLFS